MWSKLYRRHESIQWKDATDCSQHDFGLCRARQRDESAQGNGPDPSHWLTMWWLKTWLKKNTLFWLHLNLNLMTWKDWSSSQTQRGRILSGPAVNSEREPTFSPDCRLTGSSAALVLKRFWINYSHQTIGTTYAVMDVLYQIVSVNWELCLNLPIYIPVLIWGHKLWVATK